MEQPEPTKVVIFSRNFDATGEADRLMHGPNIILDHTNIYPKFHPICAGNRADYYVQEY
jgi:hypothetical protein